MLLPYHLSIHSFFQKQHVPQRMVVHSKYTSINSMWHSSSLAPTQNQKGSYPISMLRSSTLPKTQSPKHPHSFIMSVDQRNPGNPSMTSTSRLAATKTSSHQSKCLRCSPSFFPKNNETVMEKEHDRRFPGV